MSTKKASRRARNAQMAWKTGNAAYGDSERRIARQEALNGPEAPDPSWLTQQAFANLHPLGTPDELNEGTEGFDGNRRQGAALAALFGTEKGGY